MYRSNDTILLVERHRCFRGRRAAQLLISRHRRKRSTRAPASTVRKRVRTDPSCDIVVSSFATSVQQQHTNISTQVTPEKQTVADSVAISPLEKGQSTQEGVKLDAFELCASESEHSLDGVDEVDSGEFSCSLMPCNPLDVECVADVVARAEDDMAVLVIAREGAVFVVAGNDMGSCGNYLTGTMNADRSKWVSLPYTIGTNDIHEGPFGNVEMVKGDIMSFMSKHGLGECLWWDLKWIKEDKLDFGLWKTTREAGPAEADLTVWSKLLHKWWDDIPGAEARLVAGELWQSESPVPRFYLSPWKPKVPGTTRLVEHAQAAAASV